MCNAENKSEYVLLKRLQIYWYERVIRHAQSKSRGNWLWENKLHLS